jgi:hypothetical protein
MKRLTLLLLCLAVLPAMSLRAQTAAERTIEVNVSWTQIRTAPSKGGKAVALAYGNDTFTVLKEQDGWAQVRFDTSRLGWIALADTGAPRAAGPRPPVAQMLRVPAKLNLSATILASAKGLQASGRRAQARERYLELIMRYPGTPAFYEAVRQMNFYYHVGTFPEPNDGKVTAAMRSNAESRLGDLLHAEARALVAERRPFEAVSVYEYALLRNRRDQVAYNGMKSALDKYMNDALGHADTAELGLAVATFRHYFPTQPLPEAVQARMRGPAR